MELDLRLAACPSLAGTGRRVRSLYIGGGTPSTLEPEQFRRLLDGLMSRLEMTSDVEITAEANPESLDEATAEAWLDAGVNRISLGVQSLDPAVLSWLGRAAGPTEIRRALALACSTFSRVSADWILAPGCRSDRLAAEFREARDLGVGHVSFYILEWHEQTGLALDRARGLVQPDDEASIAARYLAGRDDLMDLGYRFYEISNYALPGQESRHNKAYWSRRPYLGLGPGAHGQWGNRREANHGSLDRWSQDVGAGLVPTATWERLTPAARRLERLILGLRTREGTAIEEFENLLPALASGIEEGLWTVTDDRLILTAAGCLRIDDIESWLANHLG